MLQPVKWIVVVCFSIMSLQAFAEEKETLEEEIIEIGNQICPVTGEAINNIHSFVYNGKRYNLCCGLCITPFSQDPEKFAAIAEKEKNN